jgi:hypothetical protein
MNIHPHTLKVINLALLLACLLTGITTREKVKAKARVDCSYPNLASDPIKFSWAPNTHITVEIDDSWTNSDDRDAFQSGIMKWNDWKSFDCSWVSFDTFDTHHFTDYSEIPPNNTVYWEQHEYGSNFLGNTTQFFGGVPERVVAAKGEIDPGQINNSPPNSSGPFGLFNYFGTHELGHTFGLAHCDGCDPESSIMGDKDKMQLSIRADLPRVMQNRWQRFIAK